MPLSELLTKQQAIRGIRTARRIFRKGFNDTYRSAFTRISYREIFLGEGPLGRRVANFTVAGGGGVVEASETTHVLSGATNQFLNDAVYQVEFANSSYITFVVGDQVGVHTKGFCFEIDQLVNIMLMTRALQTTSIDPDSFYVAGENGLTVLFHNETSGDNMTGQDYMYLAMMSSGLRLGKDIGPYAAVTSAVDESSTDSYSDFSGAHFSVYLSDTLPTSAQLSS